MKSEKVKHFEQTGELLYPSRELFKISFENINTGRIGFFFINGIDEILSHENFNTKIKDAKSGEEYTIKSSILRQLNEVVKL
jgi:hypothetical protein